MSPPPTKKKKGREKEEEEKKDLKAESCWFWFTNLGGWVFGVGTEAILGMQCKETRKGKAKTFGGHPKNDTPINLEM